MSAEVIIRRFMLAQKWNPIMALTFLTSFLKTRSPYWPGDTTMESDLESFLQNIANEENSWPKETPG